MKKLLAIILAIVMIMSLSLAVAAEETTEVKLEYISEDGKTKTTVIFTPETQTVKVDSLASELYVLTYETTYTVEDGAIVIANLPEQKAAMPAELAPIFGAFLPTEIIATVVHTFDNSILTVLFGDPADIAAATNLGTFTIDADTVAKLAPVDEPEQTEPETTEPETTEPETTEPETTEPENPKTGDPVSVGIFVVLMTVSGGAALVIGKKKF